MRPINTIHTRQRTKSSINAKKQRKETTKKNKNKIKSRVHAKNDQRQYTDKRKQVQMTRIHAHSTPSTTYIANRYIRPKKWIKCSPTASIVGRQSTTVAKGLHFTEYNVRLLHLLTTSCLGCKIFRGDVLQGTLASRGPLVDKLNHTGMCSGHSGPVRSSPAGYRASFRTSRYGSEGHLPIKIPLLYFCKYPNVSRYTLQNTSSKYSCNSSEDPFQTTSADQQKPTLSEDHQLKTLESGKRSTRGPHTFPSLFVTRYTFEPQDTSCSHIYRP